MLPAIFLLASIIVLRVTPWLCGPEAVIAFSGYTPIMGYALCGGLFLPRKIALWFPLVAIVTTILIINSLEGYPLVDKRVVANAVAVVAASVAGIALKKKASSAAVVLGTCFASTVLFYLLGNTVSFFGEPGYSPNLAGWWQAQTIGLPQWGVSSLEFLRRALIADLLYTGAFYALFRQSLKQPGITPAAQPVLAA